MRLTMHNVGFGDCFELEDNNHKLLVDCGNLVNELPKSAKYNTFDELVDAIYKNLDFSKADSYRAALLTHFHKDHYRGFKKISDELLATKSNNKFNKFYVPYLSINNDRGIGFVKVAIYAYWFLPEAREDSKFLLLEHMEMLKNLVNYPSDIICLKTGKEFNLGSVKFKVLWPDFPKGIADQVAEDLITNIEKDIHISNNDEKVVQNIIDNLAEFYNRILESAETIDKLNGFERKKANDKLEKEINKIYNQQKKDFKLLDELIEKKELKNNKLRWSDKLKKIFNNNINATSIVFCDKNHKLLMMGDVTKEVVDAFLFTEMRCKEELECEEMFKFLYLKAPHHGTSTHYTINIPPADHILISTGKPGKLKYYRISTRYYNHRNIQGERVCSSGKGWCQILLKNRKCYCPSCENEEVSVDIL